MNDPTLIKLRIKRNMAARELDKAEKALAPVREIWWQKDSAYREANEIYGQRLLELGLCSHCEQQKTGAHPSYCLDCERQYAGPAMAFGNTGSVAYSVHPIAVFTFEREETLH